MPPRTANRINARPAKPDPWRTFRHECRETLAIVLENSRRVPRDSDAARANAALLRHLMRFPVPGRVS